MTVVVSSVIISLVGYTSANLRYGRVVEDRADRLSAAEAGLRHVLEKVQINGLLCSTNAGNGSGVDIEIPDTISGVDVSVNCAKVDGTLSNITSWAVVVTGEGLPAGEKGFVTTSGHGKTKVFGGPSFVARPSLMGISAPLEIRDGDLWSTDAGCSHGGQFSTSTPTAVWGALSFSPANRGLWCTEQEWHELFTEPSVPAGLSSLPTNPAYTDFGTCRVFWPGRYTVEPAWAANNYLRSGDYVFANTGEMRLKHATVTAGRQGVAGDQQEIENPACDSYRDNQDVATGATFYMSGDSRFTMQAGGALEILRRQHDYDFVSIHALSSGAAFPASSLNWSNKILASAPGNGKQLAVHGQVWAPRTTVEFGEVASSAVAQLSGGVVVARLLAAASASVSGFVIQVQGSPQQDKFTFTARAEKNGTTEVRVVAQLRFSSPPSGIGVGTWEMAMNSWRVCAQTC
ncbi:hypothetical protein [Ilumatobacter sp.]|uniref:hypothetical protein n=1 Tax=Ilumatobacter sp. TaxID=1967498 RepID=UPI003B51FB5C